MFFLLQRKPYLALLISCLAVLISLWPNCTPFFVNINNAIIHYHIHYIKPVQPKKADAIEFAYCWSLKGLALLELRRSAFWDNLPIHTDSVFDRNYTLLHVLWR